MGILHKSRGHTTEGAKKEQISQLATSRSLTI
jgi:hypothetical protein